MGLNSEEVKVKIGADKTAISKDLQGITGMFKSWAGNIKGILAGISIGSAIQKLIDMAETIRRVSDSTGFSAGFVQDFRNIGIAAGLAGEKIDAALGKFVQNMKKGGDPETELRRFADSLAKVKDPAERARMAVEKFGKAGVSLLPILTQGSKGLDDLASKFSKLSESELQALEQLDDQKDQISNRLQIWGGKFLGALAVGSKFYGTLMAQGKGLLFSWTDVGKALDEVNDQENEIAARAASTDNAKRIANMVNAANMELDAQRKINAEWREKIRLQLISVKVAEDAYRTAFRDLSRTPFGELAKLTDEKRGERPLPQLQLTKAQMDAVDEARRLDFLAKQATLANKPRLADSFTQQRLDILKNKLGGVLPSSESDPLAAMREKLGEQVKATQELLSLAMNNGLAVKVKVTKR